MAAVGAGAGGAPKHLEKKPVKFSNLLCELYTKEPYTGYTDSDL